MQVTAKYLEAWLSPNPLHMLAGELSQHRWVQVMPPPGIHPSEATLGGSVSNLSSSPQPIWRDCPEQHPEDGNAFSYWHFPISHPR